MAAYRGIDVAQFIGLVFVGAFESHPATVGGGSGMGKHQTNGLKAATTVERFAGISYSHSF